MKTLQFEVAGVKFRRKAFDEAKVQRGDRLELKPEPTNKYDPHAIQIVKDGQHIGYVPRTHNKEIVEAIKTRPADVGCCADAVWASGCWVVVNIKDDAKPTDQVAK